MNRLNKRRQLQKQLDLYIDFLPACPREGLFALIGEMLAMRHEIDRIAQMTIKDLQKQVPDYLLKKESAGNKL